MFTGWCIPFLTLDLGILGTRSSKSAPSPAISRIRMVDRQARERIQALEEWTVWCDRETAELSARLSRGVGDLARLEATVEAIRASRPLRLPYARGLGALRLRDKTAKCPFGRARSSPARSSAPRLRPRASPP
jgi:hypothetical protein